MTPTTPSSPPQHYKGVGGAKFGQNQSTPTECHRFALTLSISVQHTPAHTHTSHSHSHACLGLQFPHFVGGSWLLVVGPGNLSFAVVSPWSAVAGHPSLANGPRAVVTRYDDNTMLSLFRYLSFWPNPGDVCSVIWAKSRVCMRFDLLARRRCVCHLGKSPNIGEGDGRRRRSGTATTNRKTSSWCHSCWPNDNIVSRISPLPPRGFTDATHQLPGNSFTLGQIHKESEPIAKREEADEDGKSPMKNFTATFIGKFLYITQNFPILLFVLPLGN